MFKKNPNEKSKVFDFYYTELTAISEYLVKQESEGYRLKEIDRNTMIFERCEPKKVRYSAEIFKGSTPDDFIKSCALEGWELAGKYNDELYIFRTQKSDAIDIMTDEEEKLKICAKRVLHQPGTLMGFILVFLYALHFIIYINIDIGVTLFETDAVNFIFLLFIGLFFFRCLIRIFDYFLWRFITFKKGADSQFFSLKNTVRKRRGYAVLSSLYLIVSYIVFLWICTGFFASGLCVIIALIMLCLNYFSLVLINLSFNNKERIKKSFLCSVAVTVLFCCLFAMNEYAEKRSVDNSKILLNSDNIPISLSDLGAKVKRSEDESSLEGTRLGQLYIFTSDAELLEEDENTSSYLFYNIFVSDYPDILQKYTDKIMEKYSDYELEYVTVTPPETEWDYCCVIKRDSANEYDGFAVKDNMVIYLRRPLQCENDFFEVAYEKLFVERVMP